VGGAGTELADALAALWNWSERWRDTLAAEGPSDGD
jgi:hypothetical protein